MKHYGRWRRGCKAARTDDGTIDAFDEAPFDVKRELIMEAVHDRALAAQVEARPTPRTSRLLQRAAGRDVAAPTRAPIPRRRRPVHAARPLVVGAPPRPAPPRAPSLAMGGGWVGACWRGAAWRVRRQRAGQLGAVPRVHARRICRTHSVPRRRWPSVPSAHVGVFCDVM